MESFGENRLNNESSEILNQEEKGRKKADNEELRRTMLSHLQLITDRIGPERAAHLFKKHAAWYIRGYPGSAHFRSEFFSKNRCDALLESVEEFFRFLLNSAM
jgi:tRNA-dihydrouridine synthase